MTTDRPESRARNVALFGLGFEVGLTAVLLAMTAWSGSEALRALTLLSGVGNAIWLYLVLVYHQRVLVQEETFETEQLRRERQAGVTSGAIFDVDDEQLLLARRRLRWMYRWLLPIFTVLIIKLLLLAGLTGWSWSLATPLSDPSWRQIDPASATQVIWFVGGIAFVCFLVSRYAMGMARQAQWRMLRSGASWLMGITLGAVAIGATFAPFHYSHAVMPERVLAYVLRILLLVLAIEATFNFILDFYRPRTPDEEPRPAFDSRLLGLFSEPGGIARSIADAINYQFGFEVSSTWFYKLMERAALPLVGFAVLTLFAASCFVVIEAEEQGILERFGRPLGLAKGATVELATAGTEQPPYLLGPGLHIKYPWPVDRVYKFASKQVHEFKMGTASPPSAGAKDQLILWTNEHEEEPHVVVVIATPELEKFITSQSTTQPAGMLDETGISPIMKDEGALAVAGQAVSVSLIRVAITIQYQIRDTFDWLTKYHNPEQMLEAIAGHELTRYCASVDVEALLGRQRGAIEKELWKRIQTEVDRSELGLEIQFLGLQGVHPPKDTAEAFQEVIGAEQKGTASIRDARAEYDKRLSEVAGNVKRAEELKAAIERLNQLASDSGASEETREAARKHLDALFFGDAEKGITPIGGLASGRIAQARAQRWRLENDAHAEAVVFSKSRVIKDAAPEVYYLRMTLDALIEGLQGVRKYVMAAHGEVNFGTFQLNLQDPANAQFNMAAGSE